MCKALAFDHIQVATPRGQEAAAHAFYGRLLGLANSNDRWCFRMGFNPVVARKPLYGDQLIGVVLLDGTVVEPRIE